MNSSNPLAYIQDRLLPQTEASLPLHDAGFVWGATVTDLCRTVKHQLYRFEDHLLRFHRSCRAARIFPPLAEEEMRRIALELVEHNAALLAPQQDLALVMIATPGPIGYYAGEETGAGDAEPTFIMHTFPLPFGRYRRLFQEGARLAIPSVRHVPSVCIDPRIKQRSRMHWWLAEQEAKQIDAKASALLLDYDGNVTETAAANFLLVQHGVVLSPPRGSILEGISMQVVRELCGNLGISWQERPLHVYDCVNADEAMIASTPFCLAGVSHINNQPLPWPGPLFKRILQAWSEEIGLDIQAQILGTASQLTHPTDRRQ